MIAKRLYIAVAMHDGLITTKSGQTYELSNEHGRYLFDTAVEACMDRANNLCYKHVLGEGTYTMVFECIAIVEPPPMNAPVVKYWNDDNELKT